MSPAVAAKSFRNLDDTTRAQLMKLPSNDDVLADAIKQSRVILGESGYHLPLPQQRTETADGRLCDDGARPAPLSDSISPALLTNVPALEQAAAGRGLLTIQPERDGIVRRAAAGDAGAGPAYAGADARHAARRHRRRRDPHQDRRRRHRAASPSPASKCRPTATASSGFISRPHDPARYVSAKDVLEDRVPADRIARRLVLIGTSAVGLRDIKATPIDPAMSGVEVHAQVLESVLSKSTLVYPNYAVGAELATIVLFGLADYRRRSGHRRAADARRSARWSPPFWRPAPGISFQRSRS